MRATALALALGTTLVIAAHAHAQQKVQRVGLLMQTTPAAASHITAAFAEALRERGLEYNYSKTSSSEADRDNITENRFNLASF